MLPKGFEQYIRKCLKQEKPHHVVSSCVDWLGWVSDEWEQVSDTLGSSSRQIVLRRVRDGQHVEIDVAWMEQAGRPIP